MLNLNSADALNNRAVCLNEWFSISPMADLAHAITSTADSVNNAEF